MHERTFRRKELPLTNGAFVCLKALARLQHGAPSGRLWPHPLTPLPAPHAASANALWPPTPRSDNGPPREYQSTKGYCDEVEAKIPRKAIQAKKHSVNMWAWSDLAVHFHSHTRPVGIPRSGRRVSTSRRQSFRPSRPFDSREKEFMS